MKYIVAIKDYLNQRPVVYRNDYDSESYYKDIKLAKRFTKIEAEDIIGNYNLLHMRFQAYLMTEDEAMIMEIIE